MSRAWFLSGRLPSAYGGAIIAQNTQPRPPETDPNTDGSRRRLESTLPTSHEKKCIVCGRTFPRRSVIAGAVVRNSLAERIQSDHPDWSPDSYICAPDLARYRSEYVQGLLQDELGKRK